MKQRNFNLMLLDALASSGALFLAFLIRFDFSIPENFLGIFYKWMPWFIAIQVVVFVFAGLYARMWRYTSLFDLYAIMSSVTTASALSLIYVFYGICKFLNILLLQKVCLFFKQD